MGSRRGRQTRRPTDAASRPLLLTAPVALLNGSGTFAGDGGAPGGAGAAGNGMVPQASPRQSPSAAAGLSRFALKNWRVRSRLLLLVLLPTLAAVILGGVSVVASARSAQAYQRVEQFSRLGGKITNLVQALQAEREDTIRYVTTGQACGGRGSPGTTGSPQLAVLAQDHRATDQLAAQVRSRAATIGSSYPTVAQQEARGAITAIDGLPALRSVATTPGSPRRR